MKRNFSCVGNATTTGYWDWAGHSNPSKRSAPERSSITTTPPERWGADNATTGSATVRDTTDVVASTPAAESSDHPCKFGTSQVLKLAGDAERSGIAGGTALE